MNSRGRRPSAQPLCDEMQCDGAKRLLHGAKSQSVCKRWWPSHQQITSCASRIINPTGQWSWTMTKGDCARSGNGGGMSSTGFMVGWIGLKIGTPVLA